jgi:hypothetical protein
MVKQQATAIQGLGIDLAADANRFLEPLADYLELYGLAQ